jgi:hypothetical protein
MRGQNNIPLDIAHLPHPAAPLLDRIRRTGVPVVLSSTPWSRSTLDERLMRGAHQSATDYTAFLHEEFLDFVQKGFWMLLPHNLVRDEPGL